MDSIYNSDKNKLGNVLKKINILIDETPKKNLLRYVFKNEKESVWEANYLFILSRSGVFKIYDKEIDVNGENIFNLQLLDKEKFYRFKKEFVDNSTDISKNVNHTDLTSVIPEGGKYRVVRRITKLFKDKNKVANWKIAACIIPKLRGGKKFSKNDYNLSVHYPKIKNCSVTIKKLWEDSGYAIKINKNFCEKIQI